MRRTRRLLAAMSIAMVAAACSPAEVVETVEDVVGSPLPAESPQPEEPGDTEPADPEAEPQPDEPTDGDGSDAAGDGSNAQEPAPTATQEQSPAAPTLTPISDGGPVGSNAAAYLRGDRQRVVLEIDVQDGASLSQGVLDHVRTVLARESNASIEVVTGAATSTRRDAWTAGQLRAVADATRDVPHDDGTAVLHLLVLRDGYEDDGVLGLAFDSSSAVVFPDQWSDLTTALLAGDRIARAVTTHEVGHLLGLVGLYEAPTSGHEDPEHPGHTTDQDDVMFYAVERSIIAQLDGIPIDFGPSTRADLAAIREG